MGVFATDCEMSGLLNQMAEQENPKLHNLCSINVDTGETHLFEGSERGAIQAWLDEGHTFVTHNSKVFDNPALQFLGYDTSKVVWIDSLLLSWYLEPERRIHGLGKYGEEFGVPKPVIENWEDQTQEEYNNRVIEDCKIQRKLWHKQVARLQELYGKAPGSYDRLVGCLMWKGDCLRIQQDTGMRLDIPAAKELQVLLLKKIEDKTLALIEVMPKSPTYALRQRPAKPYLKNGELSTTGLRWKELTESLSLPFEHSEAIKVVTDLKPGKPSSHTQMKAWLDSLGWSPITFKFVKDDDGEMRQIPQIALKGGLICESVRELIPKCAGIEHIAGLGILNHRQSVVTGFLREEFRGRLVASSAGFTNTLRMQHRVPLCNIPSTRVPYGEELRGLLIADEGFVLLGSDLSGVENFVKNSYQSSIDPEYVKTQLAPGYDPHLHMAVTAGLVSEDDAEWYKAYKKLEKADKTDAADSRFHTLDAIRSVGKTASYSLQYGAGVKTVARSCKVSEKVAKKLHSGYHKLNWSVPKIAGMMVTKKTSFGQWQLNPVSKFWYSLRTEKDRFSTLIQGTAAYVFDIWLYHCRVLAIKRGLDYRLTWQSHDDQVISLPIGEEDAYRDLVNDALKRMNAQLKLKVEIRCEVMFGQDGASIH